MSRRSRGTNTITRTKVRGQTHQLVWMVFRDARPARGYHAAMRTWALCSLLAAGCILLAACERRAPPAEPAPLPAVAAAPRAGWLKGQLHAHTGMSADSETPPDEVTRWYEARGYDFLVLTDHNTITTPASPGPMLVLPGVELTQNLRTCEPPPPLGLRCLLHVSALFVRPKTPPEVAFAPPETFGRLELYTRAVDAARELGGIAELDHPNFHLAADADLLVALAARGLALVEVANQAVDSNNEGDAQHPSTEAMWDAALTRGARVFATASDDAHHYGDAARVRARGETAYTGDRGFVMVRASKDGPSIRRAIEAGDFYASTGLVLARLELGPAAIAVDVQGEDALFEAVGEGGAVLSSAEGRSFRFDPATTPSRYVRVRVRSKDGRRALTQPLFRAAPASPR